MNKNYVLLRDAIIPYHPMFKGYSKKQIKAVLDNPMAYNVEYLVEQTLAYIGRYTHTDAHHSDFSDHSDSKTVSIGSTLRPKSRSLYGAKIFNVARSTNSDNLSYKAGDLRVIVFNPHKNGGECRFYFIPKSWWMEDSIVFHSNQGWGAISATYNKSTDSIKKWEPFRCKTFEELARKKSTVKFS